jgi:hypothetical protein
MYLSDELDLYNNNSTKSIHTGEFNHYLPVLSLLRFNVRDEIALVNGRNKQEEVVAYNRNTSSKSLSKEVCLEKRFDITQNDILLGPMNLVFNLTDHNVTIIAPGELRKTYRPIESKKLEDLYGKLIIMTIYTFNNPYMISDLTGYSDYFENYLNLYKGRGNKNLEEIIQILEFLKENWCRFKVNAIPDARNQNSIKVVSMVEVDEGELLTAEHNRLFCPERNLTITLENIIDTPEHPGTQNVIANSDVKTHLRNNSFVCYIVDNNDAISDRYINVAGAVKRINKIKNPNMINGLYLINTGDNGTNNEIICKLDEIDDNDYVYRSMEEANAGADIRKQYMDSIEQSRAEIESLRIKHANEGIVLKSKHEKDTLEIKNTYDKMMKEQSLLFESQLHELKKNMETFKNNNERESLTKKGEFESFKYDIDRKSNVSKSEYEERKYTRDSTVETLKTIGSVVGLVAGGVVMYSKFAK